MMLAIEAMNGNPKNRLNRLPCLIELDTREIPIQSFGDCADFHRSNLTAVRGEGLGSKTPRSRK